MEHSLGALLAQKSNEGHEQAIYYLSRTMVGAEHRYNLVEKECLALVFAEDAALFDGADYLCRIKDQSFTTSYDQTFRPQRSAHQMGHVVVTIRYPFSASEGHKGTSHCGPPCRESKIKICYPLRRTTR